MLSVEQLYVLGKLAAAGPDYYPVLLVYCAGILAAAAFGTTAEKEARTDYQR